MVAECISRADIGRDLLAAGSSLRCTARPVMAARHPQPYDARQPSRRLCRLVIVLRILFVRPHTCLLHHGDGCKIWSDIRGVEFQTGG